MCLRCNAYDVGPAGLDPAKPGRDAARALGNCIARNQDSDSSVIGQSCHAAPPSIQVMKMSVITIRPWSFMDSGQN